MLSHSSPSPYYQWTPSITSQLQHGSHLDLHEFLPVNWTAPYTLSNGGQLTLPCQLDSLPPHDSPDYESPKHGSHLDLHEFHPVNWTAHYTLSNRGQLTSPCQLDSLPPHNSPDYEFPKHGSHLDLHDNDETTKHHSSLHPTFPTDGNANKA